MKCMKVIISSLLLVSGLAAAQPMQCQVQSGKFVTPVLELYTSEGCSSCPPADRWFSSQIKRKDISANYLAFHVDYWDDIGWPDKFAHASYSQRQRARVQKNGSNTVYTPQLMIGEKTTVSWYRQDQSDSAVKQINQQLALADIRLSAIGEGAQWRAQVSLESKPQLPNAQWYFAMYQDGLSSNVSAGENSGVVLKHDRVVRQWLGPYRVTLGPSDKNISNKTIDVTLPKNATLQHIGFIAILENATNGQVLQSVKLPLSSCRNLVGAPSGANGLPEI